MNPQQLQTQTIAIIDYWISEYKRHSWEHIQTKPSANQWSLGQVGIHLWMSAKGFFFKNVERCISHDEKTATGKSKNLSGFVVFTLRRFPSVKIKMPDAVAVQPREPESKEYLIAKLEEIKSAIPQYIEKAMAIDPAIKTKHPFLGWLNAAEWVELCNIHFHHHLKQKKRIEKHLGL